MNCCSNFFSILGIGRFVTTEYRVLPSIRYSAEPSNRTEYRFSPIPQAFTNQFQQISSINSYNIRSATKYRPVFVVLMLTNSALDRPLGSRDSQSGMILLEALDQ